MLVNRTGGMDGGQIILACAVLIFAINAFFGDCLPRRRPMRPIVNVAVVAPFQQIWVGTAGNMSGIPEECPICYESHVSYLRTPCKHYICILCMENTLTVNPVCPFCRRGLRLQLEMWFLTDEVVSGLKRGTLYAFRRAAEWIGEELAATEWNVAALEERMRPIEGYFVVPMWWLSNRVFAEGFHKEVQGAIRDITDGKGLESAHVRWLLTGASWTDTGTVLQGI